MEKEGRQGNQEGEHDMQLQDHPYLMLKFPFYCCSLRLGVAVRAEAKINLATLGCIKKWIPLVQVLPSRITTDAKVHLPAREPEVAKGAQRKCQPCHQSGKHKEGIHLPVLWQGAPRNARSDRSAAHCTLRFQREQCFLFYTARFLVWFLQKERKKREIFGTG